MLLWRSGFPFSRSFDSRAPESQQAGRVRLKQIEATEVRRPGDAFEVRALDDVTLKVEEARFVAVMGPSGSGKTPTLDLLAGIDHATGQRYRERRNDLSDEREHSSLGRCDS